MLETILNDIQPEVQSAQAEVMESEAAEAFLMNIEPAQSPQHCLKEEEVNIQSIYC